MKLILEAIIQRLNTLPFLETSEEIRLQLISLLKILLVKQQSCFRESLQKIAHMFSKVFQDNFPEMKKVFKIIRIIGKRLICIRPIKSIPYWRIYG